MGSAGLLSLASALSFGAADFLGGLAARQASAAMVTLLSQLIGALVLLVALPVLGGRLTDAAVLTGTLAGVGGGGGLLLYLRSLAIGPMGVVSPLAAVVGALLPVVVGLGFGERPSLLAGAGIPVAVLAIILASRSGADAEPTRLGSSGPALAFGAGCAFGLFFVALDASPAGSGAWPLLFARLSSLALLSLVVGVARPLPPPRQLLRLIAASGALDMIANVCFLLATRRGLLSLTAVVVSGLYPIVVVLLARQILRERLTARQQTGTVLALLATALIVTS